MNNRLLVLALAAAAACSGKGSPTNPYPASDPGSVITAAAGTAFTINIPSNQTTPYRWKVGGTLDERVVQYTSNSYVPENSSAVGSGGTDVWTFRAVAVGQASIPMAQYRIDAPATVVSQLTFTVVVR